MKIDELCFDLHAQRASKASMGLVRVCKGQMLISEGSRLCLRRTGCGGTYSSLRTSGVDVVGTYISNDKLILRDKKGARICTTTLGSGHHVSSLDGSTSSILDRDDLSICLFEPCVYERFIGRMRCDP